MQISVLPACVYMHHGHACLIHRKQRKESYPLELGLEMVMSHLWVWEVKPRSSGRAAGNLNH